MDQLNISFEPGLPERHGSLRECMAVQVYQKGLTSVAGKLDLSPSKLTEKLAGTDSSGRNRGMTIDELEEYIDRYNDPTPIHYLVAKYLRDPVVQQQQALASLAKLAEQLPALMAAAGLAQKTGRR